MVSLPQVTLMDADELARHEQALRLRDAHAYLTRLLPVELAVMPSQEMRPLIAPSLMVEVAKWKPANGGLLLLGDTGAGKTIGAAYLCKLVVLTMARASAEGLSDALRVRWITARALGVARRESALGRVVEDIERAKRAKLLVIDDVGQDGNRDDFFEVMDHRYFHGHPTIITSGLTRPAMEKRFGAELWRRMTVCKGRRAAVAEHWSRK